MQPDHNAWLRYEHDERCLDPAGNTLVRVIRDHPNGDVETSQGRQMSHADAVEFLTFWRNERRAIRAAGEDKRSYKIPGAGTTRYAGPWPLRYIHADGTADIDCTTITGPAMAFIARQVGVLKK